MQAGDLRTGQYRGHIGSTRRSISRPIGAAAVVPGLVGSEVTDTESFDAGQLPELPLAG
jgi:hypothetical protein